MALVDSYLLTKLIRPQARARRVARPRLLERLAEALHVPLTVVCAPAGYGKTTLLVEWLQTLDIPAAWLTLTPEDSDVARFLAYVIRALQGLNPELGRAAQAALNLPTAERLETCLLLLSNDLVGLEQAAVLVLDDYHWVESDAVHEALASLVAHLPPPLHLVVASRTEPPIHLTRLRARAAVLELRLADLSFRPEESVQFLREVMALDLDVGVCRQLVRQTEGWPAGLQLAALSLRGGEIPSLATGQHYIFEYLAEEVLRRQPAGVQRFLLHTAVLDQLTGPLCDALTEPFLPDRDGSACLEALEHANLFTQAVDGEHCWYRYHTLFADFLRTRLQTAEAALVPELHRRAARWLAAQGDYNSAYAHALAGHDLEQAVLLIETFAEGMERRGELDTLERWLAALPATLVREHPRLSLVRAWLALMHLDLTQTRHYLEQAEAGMSPGREALRGEILAARALVAGFAGETEQSQAYGQAAMAYLSEEQNFLVGLLKFNLSLPLFMQGQVPQALHILEEAVYAAERSGTPFVALLALRLLGEGYIHVGRLSQAEQTFRQAEALVETEWGGASPLMGLAWVGLGEICRQRNDFVQAETYLREGIARCMLFMPAVALDGFMWLALLLLARQEYAAARSILQQARQISEGRGYSLLDEWWVEIMVMRLHLAQGRLEDGLHWALQAGLEVETLENLEHLFAGSPPYFQQSACYLLARFFLLWGRREAQPAALEKARRVLEYVLPRSRSAGIYGTVLEGLILLAQVEDALGQAAAAHEALHQALDLATPERAIRVFLDEGAALVPLLAAHSPAGLHLNERVFLDELLAAWEQESSPARPLSAGPVNRPSAAGPSPLLTFREIEVLRCIAAGKSNQEIAAGLVLSLNTVKKHVSTIMDKLGARNRTEAALIARQLNLL